MQELHNTIKDNTEINETNFSWAESSWANGRASTWNESKLKVSFSLTHKVFKVESITELSWLSKDLSFYNWGLKEGE